MRAVHSGLGIPIQGGTSPCSSGGFGTQIFTTNPNHAASLNGQTPAELQSRTVVDAYNVYQEAIQRAVSLNVSFADAQRRNPNISMSVQSQQVSPILSRSWAAHLLVGGATGLSEATLSSGLCTVPELSKGARACVKLMRDEGMCPADIVDKAPAELLPNGEPGPAQYKVDLRPLIEAPWDTSPSPTEPSAGSYCARFTRRTGEPCSMDKLWEKFGISEGDCGDARLYLDQEIRAFGRPQTWTLPQQFNSDGDPLFEEFAAVKYAPQAPDPMFFAAVARNDATVRVSTDTLEPQRPGLVDLVYNPAGPFVQNASDFSDTVLSLASEALQGEGGLDVGLEQTVDSSLSILTRSIVEDVPGRMYVCRDENDNIEVRVLGFDEHAQLLVLHPRDRGRS